MRYAAPFCSPMMRIGARPERLNSDRIHQLQRACSVSLLELEFGQVQANNHRLKFVAERGPKLECPGVGVS
jgi:hypothetical protein